MATLAFPRGPDIAVNLKGIYVKKLKEVAANLSEIVKVLAKRSIAVETQVRENQRLKKDTELLRKEVKHLSQEAKVHMKVFLALKAEISSLKKQGESTTAPRPSNRTVNPHWMLRSLNAPSSPQWRTW